MRSPTIHDSNTMIDVVGIGLEGATGLPRSIRDIIDRAAVLVGSDRHLRYFPDHPAKQWVLRDLEGDLRCLQSLGQGEAIAILASGDPLFFGLGRLLLEIFDPAQLTFHPHLSSIQLAFSRVKLPWQDAQFLSVHGRSLDILIPYLKQGIAKIALLTDSTSHPGAIAGLMLSLGLTCDYDCWICENLGSSDERVQRYAADKLFQLAARSASDFAPLNVVILQKNRNYTEIDLQDLPLIGILDRAFASFSDRPGLMTKREVRLQVLGQLRLQPDQILWDIGAGTGSVAIEVARLCPSSQVFAIEKTAAGIQLIQTNCQRFQVDNVKAVAGAAPDSLKDLPTPDRIFIGGTGGNLGTILDFCGEKLKERGLIVLAFATVEHLAEAIAWLQSQHWQYELLQVNISQSVAIADAHRFSPLNPVTLVTAYPLHPSIQELKIEQ